MGNNRKSRRPRKSKLTVAKLDKKVNKIISSVEIKEHYILQNLTDLGGTSTGFVLNGLQKGTDNGERIGERIKMKSILVRYRIKQNSNSVLGTDTTVAWTSTPLSCMTRIMVIMQIQNNESNVLTNSDIYEFNASTTANLISPYDLKYIGISGEQLKYKVLYDKTHLSIQSTMSLDVVREIKLSLNRSVYYGPGDAGNGLDIIKNKLFILFTPENNNVVHGFGSVLRYTDE